MPSKPHLSWRTLPFLGLLGVSAWANASEPAVASLTPELRQALAGTWVYAGGAAQQSKVDAAVDRAVANLLPLSRKIATDALTPRARPRPSYTLAFEGNVVRITSPDEVEERGEIGGPAVSTTNRYGDHSQTTFRIEGRSLVEAGGNSDGSGETVFTVTADGGALLVRRVMRSSKLAAPVDVVFIYHRPG